MDATNHTFTELKACLDVAFGGRAAEEIIFGKLKLVPVNAHRILLNGLRRTASQPGRTRTSGKQLK